MKALVVTPYYFPKQGGLEIYARQLGIALKELKEWEITVVTSGDFRNGIRQEEIDGMKVYRLGKWLKISNTPINPLWPVMIRKIMKIEKPDLIIAHSPVPSMSDSAALAAGRTPFFLVYHAATLIKDDSYFFNIIAAIYGLFEKLSFAKASKIIVVSDYVRSQMSPRLQRKISVVPNSIWKEQISLRKSQPDTRSFLFIGSLKKSHSWKGLDQILKAVAIYKDHVDSSVRLNIMGEGDKINDYRAQVARLDIDKNVIFLGPKYGIEKDNIIDKASALIVYPTTSNDAFPTVLLEAWSRGVPVISADIGPLSSLVQDSQNGYLVEASNPEALSEKMAEVMEADEKALMEIAKTAKTRTAKEYTWEKQAETFSLLVKGVHQ